MSDQARVRLLICAPCKSIEELPWYEGPQEHDDTGNYRLSFHVYANGAYHPFTVGDLPKADWDNMIVRDLLVREIVANIEGSGNDGLGQEFYDVKSNFAQDALTCWKKHKRTVDCSDYNTDRMRLLPDTRAERRAEGLDPKTRSNTFLCQFCPVESLIQTKKNQAEGLDA